MDRMQWFTVERPSRCAYTILPVGLINLNEKPGECLEAESFPTNHIIGETPLFNSDAVLVRTIRQALEVKVSTPTADP